MEAIGRLLVLSDGSSGSGKEKMNFPIDSKEKVHIVFMAAKQNILCAF
jgi:hypothetical protein